jgi:hypothetical protein
MSVEINSEPVDVAAWRRLKRRELLGKRAAMSAEERDAKSDLIVRGLTQSGYAPVGMTRLRTWALPKQLLSSEKRNLNLVIPTGAKRSGGTCSFAGSSRKLYKHC